MCVTITFLSTHLRITLHFRKLQLIYTLHVTLCLLGKYYQVSKYFHKNI